MDYARKIGKEDEHIIIDKIIRLSKLKSRVFTTMPTLQYYKEDRRLANWKKWIRIRQKQHQFLSRATNRLPEELVLNSSEKYNTWFEMKNKINVVSNYFDDDPDKLRAIEPGFWRTDEFLCEKLKTDDQNANVINEVKENAAISVTLTEKDLKPKLEVTRNIVPSLLSKEKNLGEIDKVKSKWKNNKYLKKKINEASPKLISSVFGKAISEIGTKDLINDDEVKQLVIKGKQLVPKNVEEKISKSLISEPKKKFILKEPPLVEIDSDVDIDSPIFEEHFQNLNIEVSSNKFRNFSSLTKMNNIYLHTIIFTNDSKYSKQFITLENIRNIVLFYEWREVTPNLKEKLFDNSFYFNKNGGYILPNKKIEIPVWFKSNNEDGPRIFVEYWSLEIKSEPSLKYLFRMWGIVTIQKSKNNNFISISKQLDKRVGNRKIKEILDKILEDAYDLHENNLPIEPLYKTFFIEKDLFEALNDGFQYHRDQMIELRSIFHQINNSSNWDLSLKNLWNIILHKEIDLALKSELLSKLSEICKVLYVPSTIDLPKCKTCYKSIMINFLNCFEIESRYVKENCFGLKNEVTYFGEEFEIGEELSSGGSILTDEYFDLYWEIFYIRILAKLEKAIDKICATVDSVKNLSGSDYSYLDKNLIFQSSGTSFW